MKKHRDRKVWSIFSRHCTHVNPPQFHTGCFSAMRCHQHCKPGSASSRDFNKQFGCLVLRKKEFTSSPMIADLCGASWESKGLVVRKVSFLADSTLQLCHKSVTYHISTPVLCWHDDSRNSMWRVPLIRRGQWPNLFSQGNLVLLWEIARSRLKCQISIESFFRCPWSGPFHCE